jgi:hypothetical protein
MVVGGETTILLRKYLGKQLQGRSRITSGSNIKLKSRKAVYEIRID